MRRQTGNRKGRTMLKAAGCSSLAPCRRANCQGLDDLSGAIPVMEPLNDALARLTPLFCDDDAVGSSSAFRALRFMNGLQIGSIMVLAVITARCNGHHENS